jgi:hypothetical protein
LPSTIAPLRRDYPAFGRDVSAGGINGQSRRAAATSPGQRKDEEQQAKKICDLSRDARELFAPKNFARRALPTAPYPRRCANIQRVDTVSLYLSYIAHHTMRLRSGTRVAPPVWTNEEGTLPYLIAPGFLEDNDLTVEEREERAARIIDWDAIIARAQSHPHEAECCNEGCYPLHVMCFNGPPGRAINAVFDAFPAAIDSFTDFGLPLDIVLYHYPDSFNNRNQIYQTAEVPRLLVRLHMEWQEQNGPGNNPLGMSVYHSYDYPEEVISLLLQDYPALAVRRDDEYDDPAFDDSPLEKMSRFYSCDKDEFDYRYQNLDKLYALLRAYDRAPTGSTHPLNENLQGHQPVHTFLSYVVSRHDLYGGEVEEDNSHGFLPMLEAMLDDDPNQFGVSDRQGRLPLNVLVESRCPPMLSFSEEIVQLLVEMHPQSASTANREGRLPLHLALENGWPFKPIMEAAKQAISTRDVLTRMYPFQLAGCSNPGIDDANEEDPNLRLVDATYKLLLQNPTLVRSGNDALHTGGKAVTRMRKKSKTKW